LISILLIVFFLLNWFFFSISPFNKKWNSFFYFNFYPHSFNCYFLFWFLLYNW
jgi:hypothetical protein